MNSTITIRLNEKEKKIFARYAEEYNVSLSELIKQLALEKIEDELDLSAVERYEEGVVAGSITNRPYSKLLNEVGLN